MHIKLSNGVVVLIEPARGHPHACETLKVAKKSKNDVMVLIEHARDPPHA